MFTEPLVLAALAAPPFDPALGPDVSQCRTAYTTGTSTTTGRSDSWAIEVGPKVGLKAKLGQAPV